MLTESTFQNYSRFLDVTLPLTFPIVDTCVIIKFCFNSFILLAEFKWHFNTKRPIISVSYHFVMNNESFKHILVDNIMEQYVLLYAYSYWANQQTVLSLFSTIFRHHDKSTVSCQNSELEEDFG